MRVLVALVAVVVSLSVVAALAPLLGATSKTVIPDRYLVIFHEDATPELRDSHIAELVAHRFAPSDRILHVYHIGNFIGYAAVLSKETLASELAHPNIKYIEADQIMSIYENNVTQGAAPWGISRSSTRNLPVSGTYFYPESAGLGVTVYVIDTGIYIKHNEFGGRASFGFSAIDAGTEDPTTDLNGHGTHVAGTIGGATYGIAKKATIIHVKVLNGAGSGTLANVVAGIDWVTRDHGSRGKDSRSVANMSLGGGATTSIDQAVNQSVAAGVNHVVAAGNSAANACNYSPARTPRAITVGATDNTDTRASYSNTGNCIDVFAPGSNILSTWIGGPDASNTISGTSMASPHVAGVVALLLGRQIANLNPEPTPPAINEQWIATSATAGKVINAGTGSPNLLLFNYGELPKATVADDEGDDE